MNAKQRSKYEWGLLLGLITVIVLFVSSLWYFSNDKDQEPPMVGMVLLGGMDEEGWNAPQYRGMKKACDSMGVKLLVSDHNSGLDGACADAVREMVKNGAGMVFLTSYSYTTDAKTLIREFPQIAFGTNSAECRGRNMTSYFIRMYQGRYLTGALAGLRTKSNIIGYVAAMPNSEVNRGINAFTLGVKRTNPQARVIVMYTGSWQDEEIEAANANRLITKEHADVITYHQDEPAAANVAEELGIDYIGYYEDLQNRSEHDLTSVVCNWDRYYEEIVKYYLKGEMNFVDNRWVGMEAGLVELSPFSDAVDYEQRGILDQLKKEMMAGNFVFAGEIYDNQGKLRCRSDEVIRDDRLLQHMDWLVKGVEVLE
ncbi:membrane protein, Bmp family [Anaerovibrio sp. JC8]|uniref:BMP family ABC transporter substrate-binding protein n=1 Tax=Anaerovibrio sp. JC8 TaxID=1240085 RepID=UPI000A0A0B4E|nr:BMP family ABC transporter substrate-binding protein [Anaerovibrio sp. JC8]ORT99246.1 membrane protein, Bmp family [Anaerovibrio sp. JC8]